MEKSFSALGHIERTKFIHVRKSKQRLGRIAFLPPHRHARSVLGGVVSGKPELLSVLGPVPTEVQSLLGTSHAHSLKKLKAFDSRATLKLPVDVTNALIKRKFTFPSKMQPVPEASAVVGKRCGTPAHTRTEPTQGEDWVSSNELIQLKLRVYCAFLESLRVSNGVRLTGLRPKYRFFIGPGNNSNMVRRVLRSRWWWTSANSPQQSHFVWTSVKHNPTIARLPYSQRGSFEEDQTPPTSLGIAQYSEQFKHTLITEASSYCRLACTEVVSSSAQIHNRLNRHKQISNKKFLFNNLRLYYRRTGKDLFQFVPVTFHVKAGAADAAFAEFKEYYAAEAERSAHNIWIIKPGEKTNRGFGISMSHSLSEIEELVSDPEASHTFIIQKYIADPLLIHNRKFDIRCYALVTSINGVVQTYFYQDGYIRTSGHEFTLSFPYDKFVHLTNDAIQKDSEAYGKYEPGNKWSYAELQAYLNEARIDLNFEAEVLPAIKEAIADTIRATFDILDPERKLHTFEVLGYDFMVDQQKRVWLIEGNTNPCLEQSCYYLSKLLPEMMENTFRIVLDPLFPPPTQRKPLVSWLTSASLENRYELIFSEPEHLRRTLNS